MFDAPTDAKPKPPRPRDAATLILVRRRNGEAEVLMGQRHAGHKFMPNKFVFPGGRLDPSDLRLSAGTPLPPEVLSKLVVHTSPERALGLARAAIRETFEEAGLLVARPATKRAVSRSKGWSRFLSLGVEPDLSALSYVARAITPPYRDRRFDTRFFIADESALVEPAGYSRVESGELLTLRWVTVEEARTLDLPNITRRVLDEIEARVERPQVPRPAPFFRFVRGKPLMDLI